MKNKKLATIPILILAIAAMGFAMLHGLGLFYQKPEHEALVAEEPEPVEEVEEIDLSSYIATTTDTKDIAALQEEMNPDIYAWITVKGTTVDFPILQSEEDNYYLDHTVDKVESLPGAIYTNAVDGKVFDRSNTVIYGHNMKNGSYFGQLHLYEDEDFFKENNEFYIYTIDRKLTYTVIAASTFNNNYLPAVYSFSLQLGAESFLQDLMNYAPDADSTNITDDMSEWSQLVTLSTCVSGQNEQRYLVVGSLSKVEMYK